MFKSAVYHGNSFMGEVEIYPKNPYGGTWAPREIRISHLSQPSERCPPLAVLHTVAAAGLRFKMESRPPPPMAANESSSPLSLLHATCLKEKKTAVVPLGEEELHLVPMFSRKNLVQYSCFWGFIVAPRLYHSCLVMLNRRCLGIVFDLDETLVVANTMRSFEDRIDALQRKISNETDPQRVTGMLAEIRRYQDDKSILKQYIENDQVVDNGKVFKVQSESVPPLSDSHQLITRPVIRLQEKNIILTRVNPAIRDTSVLVRLRPAWEDLRSYLTARGRKRFEVYVCTMAERDYALEMWRLLDPESNLINSRELLDRIVCVKSGLRKSLLSVFEDGICHPKMALVIDDRLKVWDEKDQPRVHVVPAFAPYYAPLAEANNTIPVLCVARNVACNVRGGFFKEFDEGLLPRVTNAFFEDEMSDFPSAPDVGNYLISDDDTFASNGSKDPLPFEGITDVEAEKRLKVPNFSIQAVPPMVNNLDPRSIPSLPHLISSSGVVPMAVPQMMIPLPINQCSQSIALGKPLGSTGFPEPSLQCSPAREEGEVPESELDPDTRRRLLILQHGQDNREPPLPPPPPSSPPPPFHPRPPLQVSVPTVQSSGGWFPSNKEISPRQLKRAAKEYPLELEAVHFNKRRSQHASFFRGGDNNFPSDRGLNGNQQYPMHGPWGDDNLRSNHTVSNHSSFTGKEMPVGKVASNHRDVHLESSWAMTKYAETSVGVLQEIAMKCGTTVEYRTAIVDTSELQFSVEVWFVGEKIGEGIGKTRKEAQHYASEKSLKYLANRYLLDTLPDSAAVHRNLNKLYHTKDNGFINGSNSFGHPTSGRNDKMPVASTSEESRLLDQRFEKRSLASISALKDLCTTEGFNLVFQSRPSVSDSSANKSKVHAQVEIAGQILGKGIGTTWEDAKLQAADEAHVTLKSMLGQFTQNTCKFPKVTVNNFK